MNDSLDGIVVMDSCDGEMEWRDGEWVLSLLDWKHGRFEWCCWFSSSLTELFYTGV